MYRRACTKRIALAISLLGASLALATPAANAAPPPGSLDTVSATGSGALNFSEVNITAQSEPSGQNATGTASFRVFGPNGIVISGPVTCLSVTGPDQGAGTPGSPTTAVLNVDSSQGPDNFGIVTVQLVDNGGNGADIMNAAPIQRAPADCSPVTVSLVNDTLTNGRAVVFDAPLLPTSKEQCKNGGWQSFGTMFKNQGQCVAFVERGPRTH